MFSLVGPYQCELDDQGRVVIPAAFRREGGASWVSIGWDGSSISLFPLEAWEVVRPRLMEFRRRGSRASHAVLRMLAQAALVELDAKGRMRLTPPQLEYLGVGSPPTRVLTLGRSGRVEIWGPKRWEEGVRSAD